MTRRHPDVPAPLRKQLKPDEFVLWHGQPQDKFDFREVPLLGMIMAPVGGVLFGGIGVALLYVYFFKAPWRAEPWAVGLLLFGLVFLATGLYILLGPWLQRLARRHTFYAVTDRRVIIVNERPWHRVVAFDLERIVSWSVALETPDGSGDIELRFNSWTTSEFEFIRNVREVEALLAMAKGEAVVTFGAAPPTPWPPGKLGDPAPKALAWLNVLILYFCVGFYPILIWVDMKELSRLGLSGWEPPPAYSEHGIFSPASFFFLAPFMMFFFYSRARKFQAETKVTRYYDAAVAVILVILGLLLLIGKPGSMFEPGGRTGGFVILSVFALLMARGRSPHAEAREDRG